MTHLQPTAWMEKAYESREGLENRLYLVVVESHDLDIEIARVFQQMCNVTGSIFLDLMP